MSQLNYTFFQTDVNCFYKIFTFSFSGLITKHADLL